MDWFKKEEEEEPKVLPKPEYVPPEIREKTDQHCEVEGCFEVKAPGQNHVCTAHVRSN